MKQTPKSPRERQQLADRLYKAILQLETVPECRAFFADLCTPAEIEAMADRWGVVGMLMEKTPYRAIAAETGTSVVTIGRVARCLNGGNGGYRLALERLGKRKT